MTSVAARFADSIAVQAILWTDIRAERIAKNIAVQILGSTYARRAERGGKAENAIGRECLAPDRLLTSQRAPQRICMRPPGPRSGTCAVASRWQCVAVHGIWTKVMVSTGTRRCA